MRNQPLNSVLHAEPDSDEDSLIDPPRGSRFWLLGAGFLAGACVVLCRIAWVQASLQDRYLDVLNSTSVEYEIIPARSGRILGEGSEIYATDVEQYVIEMHYRWLQEPPDEGWLRRQIRRRLSARERRQPEVVERIRHALLEERRNAVNQLLTLTGLSASEFSHRRQSIQERVVRIADAVNRRHLKPLPESESRGTSDGLFMRMAASVRSALTTTPRRKSAERIVVREEESYHRILTDIPFSAAATIREQPHLFAGMRVVAENRRSYPGGSLAAHVVGARTDARDDETDKTGMENVGGMWKPGIGRFGVERSYNHRLQCSPGLRRVVRSYRQEILESSIEREPVSGRDVILTLNHALQTHAEQLLGEVLLDRPLDILTAETAEETHAPQPVPTGGSIVVMDAHTGRMLALASAPGFDLSLFAGGTEEDWATINADKRHPFISRSTSMALPPGSVMKPFTAAAALETASIDPDEPFHCQGYLSRPDEHRCLVFRLLGRGHGETTLTRALAQSCNVYFFAAAREIGFSPLRDWCERFGFGRRTGVDLPFEKRGHIPGTTTTEDNVDMSRETLGLAIGQSGLTVTPLQTARAVAAIANGGWLVTPHVVSPDGVARSSRDTDDRPQAISRRRISGLSEESLLRIREGLESAVGQPWGTGFRTVRLDDVQIAGKTGTAETAPGKPDHAWFAGYAPADKPKIAFVVVLEHGGSGSRAAGPVAHALVSQISHLGLLN